RTLVLAGCLLLAISAVPYLNVWWMTGNPIYPFRNQVFRSPYVDTERPLQDERFRKALNWKTPYELTFHSHSYFEGQDGSLGFQYFLFLIPVVVLINRRAPRVVL